MKIEEYSPSVLKKAKSLIDNNKVQLNYPEPANLNTEENMFRFFIIPDIEGSLGNEVHYLVRKDVWTCTCKHWSIHTDDNCKHICACKMLLKELGYEPSQEGVFFDTETGSFKKMSEFSSKPYSQG